MGEPAFAEKPGDISELELPQGISAFVKELRRVTDDRTPIVLALVEGRPRLLGSLPHTVRENLEQTKKMILFFVRTEASLRVLRRANPNPLQGSR